MRGKKPLRIRGIMEKDLLYIKWVVFGKHLKKHNQENGGGGEFNYDIL
jgi:hypothetical protein